MPVACRFKLQSHIAQSADRSQLNTTILERKMRGHFKLHLMSVKPSNFVHYVYLVSWTNLSDKPLKTIILTFNKPLSFFVVRLGSENLIFCKDYHRNNNNDYCLLLLERSYCIFPLSSTSARSMSLI